MLLKGDFVRRLPTLSKMNTRTCSGVLGVRFELIGGFPEFSLDKVKTHPAHPLWSHTRNIDMIAYPDRLVYSIPIYSEQDRLGFNTLSLSIATGDTKSFALGEPRANH